LLVGLCKN